MPLTISEIGRRLTNYLLHNNHVQLHLLGKLEAIASLVIVCLL